MFARSFGDAFGTAIRGDLAALITAYYLMAGYLFLMLSRYDTVNSMIGMSWVALAICGMSFMSCIGMGGCESALQQGPAAAATPYRRAPATAAGANTLQL